MLLKIEPVARSNHDDIGWGICPRCKAAEYVPPSHTFAEPGVCPPIVSISYTANQFLIDGFFSTASFWLRGCLHGRGEKGQWSQKGYWDPSTVRAEQKKRRRSRNKACKICKAGTQSKDCSRGSRAGIQMRKSLWVRCCRMQGFFWKNQGLSA